ncbi:hypothetical protein RUM43_001510 [Polyplax serrata]|uniref:Uncharacterized protein n=1 Tax=Polyplax serrata TaxID=468196 RepID=A0AAN8XQC3_POLSC
MVLMQSTGSNHHIISFRERLDDKKEIIFFDPDVGMDCVYKEIKKIRSMRNVFEYKKQNNEHTYGKIDEPSQTA